MQYRSRRETIAPLHRTMTILHADPRDARVFRRRRGRGRLLLVCALLFAAQLGATWMLHRVMSAIGL